MTEPSEFVLEPLREGADFILYRGRQHGNPSPVLAVALAAQHPSPESFQWLEHEYSIAAELDAAWAAKLLALTRHEGQTVLILTDPSGEPLDRVLERNHGRPLDRTHFLRIAISLAKALGQVHRQGLIHRDLKPENVLVDVAGKVWLTGFGIASQLLSGCQVPVAPEIIAGTFAYMAPEQTGRMNRSMDTRSDLYSLGVTFYQMLAGRLPFTAADPLEWIHSHIARRPITPDDRAAVPEVLSCLTLKLLAKNAEERYQTAAGLEVDLQRCLTEWERWGRIDLFPLGAQDVPERLLISEKLYGREREIEALLAAFDRVLACGTAELVLVSGYSGIGKSSVVNELHKVLVPPRGLFASGKGEQYKRDIPYATLAQAFQTLIRQILVKSEAEVKQWRGAILEAVGPNGQLIVNLIQELEFIVGKQPLVPDLPSKDVQNRLQLAFRQFLGVFAWPEHPLTLFFDDLQWLDAAMLDLLQTLITHPEVQYLLVVGAYSDNEVGLTHPLMRTLEAIRGTDVRVQEIVLANLPIDEVGRLVSDALHCEAEAAVPLVQLAQEKTQGGVSLTSNAAKLNTPRMLLLCFVFFLFTISPVSALNTSRQISQYGHTAWRIADGVFAGMPNAIAQTTDGYLWIGTQSGLTRFDGVRFVSWRPPEGKELSSSRINSLLGARDGSLWIGTAMGLARWRNGQLTNYRDPAGSIMAILEDRAGTIWIVRANISDSKGPLCKVIDTGLRCYGRDDGVTVPYAVALANDSLGNLWLAGGPMVSRWQTGSADTYVSAGLDPAEIFNGVLALASRPDGSLWVGVVYSGKGGGLQQLVQGAWKPFVTPEFDGSTLEVTALLLDRDNSLWVGTLNQGIYRIQGNKVDHFRSSDGLSGDAVTGLFQDREGNIWIATSSGIDNLHDLRVASFSTRQGLSADQVDSVLASRDGTVWIGNYNLDALRSDKITSIQPQNRLPGRRTTSLLEDRAGRLWVGVDRDLSVYERGTFRKIPTRDGSPLGGVRAMAEDVDGSIWAATNNPANRNRLFRIQDLRIREEISSPQLPAINTLAPDPHGGVWLGLTSGGLARFRNGQKEFFPFNGLHDGPVFGLLVNSDASILAATPSGLVGWRNGSLQTLTARNGLPCDVIYSLISDRQATLWLYAACGVIAIPNTELQRWWESPNATVKSRLFDVFDGARPMSTPFQPNVSLSPDGRLWFANQSVVQMIDPAHLDSNPIVPPVHVEEMIADHKNYAPQDGLRLPPLTRDLEVDYTALSFVAPQKVRFRYKLERHDSEWQDPGTRRQAFYADLRPGNYRFRVIACNNDGVWNEEGATLAFSLAPAWYQTWWFRGASLAIFLALLWTLYQLRLRQLAQQFNITLDARVNERTRIARELHDTLLQSFQALLLRLQTVRNVLPGRPEEAAQRLDRAIDQTAQAITEGRDAVHELRSSAVVANDLAQAIGTLGADLAAQETNQTALVFGVEVEGTPRNLQPILRDEVYRIASEAMRNAFRHAEAQRIDVEIGYDDRHFRMRVRDDGRGIDPKILTHDGRAGHYGLHGMRERAKLIGGHLEVWSKLNSGTEVELNIPATIAYRPSSGHRSGPSGE